MNYRTSYHWHVPAQINALSATYHTRATRCLSASTDHTVYIKPFVFARLERIMSDHMTNLSMQWQIGRRTNRACPSHWLLLSEPLSFADKHWRQWVHGPDSFYHNRELFLFRTFSCQRMEAPIMIIYSSVWSLTMNYLTHVYFCFVYMWACF